MMLNVLSYFICIFKSVKCSFFKFAYLEETSHWKMASDQQKRGTWNFELATFFLQIKLKQIEY